MTDGYRFRLVWIWRRTIAEIVVNDLNEKVAEKPGSHPNRIYKLERATLFGRVPFGWDIVKYLEPQSVSNA